MGSPSEESTSELTARALDAATRVADSVTAQVAPADLGWGAAPGVFAWNLTEFAGAVGRPSYDTWLRQWMARWREDPPTIDRSARVVPALAVDMYSRRTGETEFDELVERAARYVRRAPRIAGDAVNHLGTSALGRLYPRSVWVDGLMMFTLFAAVHGSADDPSMLARASRQPRLYSQLLQDPSADLWYHSWLAQEARQFPGRGRFWARGNGWASVSLARVLDVLGPEHEQSEEIQAILQRTSAALLAAQREDGTWCEMVGRRGRRELSASALIAASWLGAIRSGWMNRSYLGPAQAALAAVVDAVRREPNGRWVVPEVSPPMVPGIPWVPGSAWRVHHRESTELIGAAALLMATRELVSGQRAAGPVNNAAG